MISQLSVFINIWMNFLLWDDYIWSNVAPRHLYLNVLVSLANGRKLCKPKEQPIFMIFSHQSFMPLLPILEKISSMLGIVGFPMGSWIPWKIYCSFTAVFKKRAYIFRRKYLNRNAMLWIQSSRFQTLVRLYGFVSVWISHICLCVKEIERNIRICYIPVWNHFKCTTAV